VNSPRENTALGIAHPEWVEGRRLWIDPEVQALVDKLHYGDPTIGWEGDERLALYREDGDRWLLMRLEHDGEYRPVCRSRPGLPLDERLIMHLVAHDARRGVNPADKADAANAAVTKELDYQSTQKVHSAAEKLQWALRRDLG
jgi:hypothetical protein